jgi:hypothetical protein
MRVLVSSRQMKEQMKSIGERDLAKIKSTILIDRAGGHAARSITRCFILGSREEFRVQTSLEKKREMSSLKLIGRKL